MIKPGGFSMGGRKVSSFIFFFFNRFWAVLNPDRPDFDTSKARRRDLRGNLDRLVQVSGLNEIVAAELLLGLRKRAIGGSDRSVSHPDCGRRLGGLKSMVSEEPARFLDLVGEREVLAMNFLSLRLRQLQRNGLVLIYQTQVFHSSPFIIDHAFPCTR